MARLSEVLREVHDRFAAAPLSYGHGTDNAWDEAVALVMAVTGLPDEQSSLDAQLQEQQVAAIRELAERRIVERQPLAYLLGMTPYCGEMFHVPPGVIVPRSPVGPLLKDGLRPWIQAPERILDLCCGSGSLGILAAKRFPDARVVLADIDSLAVETALRNIAEHGLEGRVEAVRSDLFAGLEAGVSGKFGKAGVHGEGVDATVILSGHTGSAVTRDNPGNSGRAKRTGDANRGFDLILCNPPYVHADAMGALPPEFAREPALGLAGGSDGLALLDRVIRNVSGYLAADGALVGEVGDGGARLEARWPRLPFIWPDLPAGGAGVFLLRAADLR